MRNLNMKNKVFITLGLILFVLVLIGVTMIQSVVEAYPEIEPLVPMIVITGFFTFLVSVAMFSYGVINSFRRKK